MSTYQQYAIATIGSHSALQILKGAQEEGFKTVCICAKGKEEPYKSFGVADELLLVNSYHQLFEIEQQLIDAKAILIPHASLIAHFGIDKIKQIRMPYFGDKSILEIEADRDKQHEWLKSAGLTIPQTFERPEQIDRPCMVKSHGADGGEGYFLTDNKTDFYERITQNNITKFHIQEYVVGVPAYIHYFYSPITDEIELLGFDRRYESNVDGIGRITAKDQSGFNLNTSYTVVGNTPLVLRESLLPKVFKMGRAVVEASRALTGQGLYGAFSLETIITPDQQFYVFEISARIVAGTSVHINGSPYTYLKYKETMSTGRRIAREIKRAIATDQLDKVTAWSTDRTFNTSSVHTTATI